jgi:hypothetical protein
MLSVCQSCKDRECCVARPVTERESIFAWAMDRQLGCEDYVEDCYHGLEGVRA